MSDTVTVRFKHLKVGDEVIMISHYNEGHVVKITKVTRTTVFSGDMGFDVFTGRSTSKRHQHVRLELVTPEALERIAKRAELDAACEWLRSISQLDTLPDAVFDAANAIARDHICRFIKERLPWELSRDEKIALKAAVEKRGM